MWRMKKQTGYLMGEGRDLSAGEVGVFGIEQSSGEIGQSCGPKQPRGCTKLFDFNAS